MDQRTETLGHNALWKMMSGAHIMCMLLYNWMVAIFDKIINWFIAMLLYSRLILAFYNNFRDCKDSVSSSNLCSTLVFIRSLSQLLGHRFAMTCRVRQLQNCNKTNGKQLGSHNYVYTQNCNKTNGKQLGSHNYVYAASSEMALLKRSK